MGHKVFAIDKSKECIDAANEMLSSDWDCQITKQFALQDLDASLMCADFFADDVMTHLEKLTVDAIIIWQGHGRRFSLHASDSTCSSSSIMVETST